ncbi:hypothetical protein IT418_02600 [bacterium]|nr:hypothetical protein [bacterium]
MKLLQVFLAFASIYLFCSAVALIFLFCSWLQAFYPDSSGKPFAKISESFTYEEYKNSTAFAAMMRIQPSAEEAATTKIFSASPLILEYEQGVLSEQLVPLGFSTLYQLEKVQNEEGKILYERPTSLVNQLFRWVFRNKITWSTKNVVLVATTPAKTYTVTALPDTVQVDEN